MNAGAAGGGRVSVRLLPGLLLVLMTVLAYLPALQAEYVWDDRAMTANPLLESAEGLGRVWFAPSGNPDEQHYWPLVYTVFWIQRAWWGIDPFGYHLCNVLLHVANSLILWLLLSRLGVGAAWPAAALFALHPVHVESVAWVIELKDVLSGFFYLLSMLAFFVSCDAGGRRWWYFGSLLLFVCGMLSKSIVVSLPMALLLVFWWQTGSVSRRQVARVLPFVLVAVAIAAFDLRLVARFDAESPSLSVAERALIAGRAWWFYLAKVVVPIGLTPIYPRWDVSAGGVPAYLYPLAAVLAAVVLFALRTRIGRTPFCALAFHALTLAPVLGFVSFAYMQHSYVADRFQYLASIGPIVLVASGLLALAPRLPWKRPMSVHVIHVPLLVLLAVLTFLYARVYRNSSTLFQHTILRNPGAWAAYLGQGVELSSQGRMAEALVHFEKALSLNSENSMVRYNLAHALMREGDLAGAERHLLEAVRITPGLARAHVGLGVVSTQKGDLGAAAAHFRRALEINPRDPVARRNLDAVTSSTAPTSTASRK